MLVYKLTFTDNSCYIGATTKSLDIRVGNHLAKFRSGKHKERVVYQKMAKYGLGFKREVLGVYSSVAAMFKAEEMYIALNKGFSVNNSVGGRTCKGKTVSEETKDKMRKPKQGAPTFSVHCSKSKDLLYLGNSKRDAEKEIGCSFANISSGLKRVTDGFIRSRKNNSKYIFAIEKGVL